jgi:hypothetical protein
MDSFRSRDFNAFFSTPPMHIMSLFNVVSHTKEVNGRFQVPTAMIMKASFLWQNSPSPTLFIVRQGTVFTPTQNYMWYPKFYTTVIFKKREHKNSKTNVCKTSTDLGILNHWKTKKWKFYLSNALRFSKEYCFLEDPQASPVCPSGKSKVQTKVRVEHWWVDTDRETRSTRKKNSQYHFVHYKSKVKIKLNSI